MIIWDEGNSDCSRLLDFLAMLGPQPVPRSWLNALLRQEKGFVGHQGFAVSSDSDLIDAGVEAGALIALDESHSFLSIEPSAAAQRLFTINNKRALRAARWNALTRFAGNRGREINRDRHKKHSIDEALRLVHLAHVLYSNGFAEHAFDLAHRITRILKDLKQADAIEKLLSTLLENVTEQTITLRHVVSINNLADILQRQKKYAESCATWEKALAWSESAFGPAHFQAARARAGFAAALANLGRFEEAQKHAWQAVASYRQGHGDNHVNLAILQTSMGSVCFRQGKFDEAIECARQSIDIYERQSNPQYEGLALSRIFIAAIYLKQKDYVRTREHGEKALEAARQLFSDGHPGLETYLGLLAVTCNHMQDFIASKPIYTELLALRLSYMPSNAPNVITARTLLARALDKLGEFAAAKEQVTILIPDMESQPSINAVMLASMHHKLAMHLKREGDFNGALAEFRKMVEVRDAYNIPDDINIANGCWNAACIARDGAKKPEQEFFLARALAAYKASLPPADPRIARTERAQNIMNAALKFRELIEQAKARKKAAGESGPLPQIEPSSSEE